ncbi:MAG TPA: hypothetical protein DDY91_18785 [Planctomycetaceae bacterium]|nr:hypothetical protein [Planctomycetaceae bacterium]
MTGHRPTDVTGGPSPGEKAQNVRTQARTFWASFDRHRQNVRNQVRNTTGGPQPVDRSPECWLMAVTRGPIEPRGRA